MKFKYKSCFLVLALLATTAIARAAAECPTITLQQEEIAEIMSAQETYAYFGPAMCSLIADLPALTKMARASGMHARHFDALCELVSQGYTTAPATMVKAAVEEAAACVAACKAELSAQEVARIADALEQYDHALQSGAADLVIADDVDDAEAATRGTKKFDNIIVRNHASIGSLFVGGDETVHHNLTVDNDLLVKGNEIINGTLTVRGATIFTGTSTTISGDLKVLRNIKLPDANAAGTVGVLQLGVDPIYEFNMGTSNFFAGDYTVGMPSPVTLTGANNISIGTQANSTLTISSQNISIGSNTRAGSPTTAGVNNCIALGLNATATGNVSTALGSSANASGNTSLAVGILTQANGNGSVAIGGGSQANAFNAVALGASTVASGISSIALGDGTTASGLNSIAMGTGTSSSTNGIAIGEGVTVLGDNGIALGTSATATGNTSSIAIGNGAQALFPNSIAIGTSVVTTSSGTFIGGIYNALVVGQSVTIKSDGQLGTTVSARRFKENFRSLDNHSAQIYNLNPVKFDYKAEHGGARDQFGLIADDVAKHLPEIVVHDKDGEIYSVQYHVLPTLLLNEMKHLAARVAQLEAALQKAR